MFARAERSMKRSVMRGCEIRVNEYRPKQISGAVYERRGGPCSLLMQAQQRALRSQLGLPQVRPIGADDLLERVI